MTLSSTIISFHPNSVYLLPNVRAGEKRNVSYTEREKKRYIQPRVQHPGLVENKLSVCVVAQLLQDQLCRLFFFAVSQCPAPLYSHKRKPPFPASFSNHHIIPLLYYFLLPINMKLKLHPQLGGIQVRFFKVGVSTLNSAYRQHWMHHTGLVIYF